MGVWIKLQVGPTGKNNNNYRIQTNILNCLILKFLTFSELLLVQKQNIFRKVLLVRKNWYF